MVLFALLELLFDLVVVVDYLKSVSGAGRVVGLLALFAAPRQKIAHFKLFLGEGLLREPT